MLFITGSSGFVGKNVTNFIRNKRKDITQVPRSFFSLTNKEQCENFKRNHISCLIHLAAAGVIDSKVSFADVVKFNVFETIKCINSALEAGCKNFVVIGSCYEYGLTGNSKKFLDVGDQLQPVGYYAMSKAATFVALQDQFQYLNINFSYLRLFHVYGHNEHHSRLYPSLCKAALNGEDFPMSSGEQIRDFIHVDDVCKIIDKAIDLDNGWNVQNVCTGVPLSVLEFARLQWQLLEAKGQLLPGQIQQKQSDLIRLVGKKSKLNF